MGKFAGGHSMVCKEICDAFGLKHVVSLDLHMAYDEIVTVTAKYYLEEDGVRALVPILKRFALMEIGEPSGEIAINDEDFEVFADNKENEPC